MKIAQLMQAVVLAALLSARVPGAEAQSVSQERVPVGALLPLSGSYAAVGEDTRRGMQQALQDGASQKLEVYFEDSRADPATSVNAFRALASRKVTGVFAFRGPVGMAVVPLAKQLRIPVLGGVGNKEFTRDNEFAFQLWPRSDDEGQFIAREMARAGVQRIAIMSAEDDWTMAVSRALEEVAPKEGVQVLRFETVAPQENDLRSIIARIHASGPSAIFVNLGISQLGPAVRQIRALGEGAPLYTNFWANKDEVRSSAGDALAGAQYAEMRTDLPGIPTGFSGATLSSYVGTMILWRAASALSSEPTAEALAKALQDLSFIDTPAGRFEVRKRCVIFPLVMRKIAP